MSINDLSDTIVAKSDQLNAADLMGADKVIKVTGVVKYVDKGENKFYLNYEGDSNRPYKPSLTMRRIITELWTTDGNLYPGRSIKLFRDPEITFGKEKCGGIVINAMSNIKGQATVRQQVSQRVYKTFIIDKLEPKELPPLNDVTFAKWLTAAKQQIESGEQTNEQIITKIETKSTLTDSQKSSIREIGASEEPINKNEDEFESDD
jgi:predicted RNA-binding protein